VTLDGLGGVCCFGSTSLSVGRFTGSPHHLQGKLDTKLDSSGCGKVKFSFLHTGQLIKTGSDDLTTFLLWHFYFDAVQVRPGPI
jgi:hypothetical protein